MRRRVPLPGEFVLLAESLSGKISLPEQLKRGRGFPEGYPWSLGRDELDGLVLLLLQQLDKEEKAAVLALLKKRMSPRLSKMIWALCQYYYKQENVREAAAAAAGAGCCAEELLVLLFRRDQDMVRTAAEVISKDGGELAGFIDRYHVLEQSPWAAAVFDRFFLQAGEREFLINEPYFLTLVETCEENDLQPMLVNYLKQPWKYYSSRKINRMILGRFGLPSDGMFAIWDGIDPALKVKYRQWIFIDMMEEYFGINNRKNTIFSQYYQEIEHIRFFQDRKIMVLDFENFGIINLRERPDFAFLMEKAVLENELIQLEPEGGLGRLNMSMWVEARDVIIEERTSDLIVLNFAQVGKLYVMELMQELLRPGDDLWPVRFRHAVARFKEAVI